MPYDPNSLMPRYRSWEDPMTGNYLQHLVANQRTGEFKDLSAFAKGLGNDDKGVPYERMLDDIKRQNAMAALFNVFARQAGKPLWKLPEVSPAIQPTPLPSKTFEDDMIDKLRRQGKL